MTEAAKQAKMVEIPKPGNLDQTILVNPNDADLPGWQKRAINLMQEKDISAQEAIIEMRQEDSQDSQDDHWTDH